MFFLWSQKKERKDTQQQAAKRIGGVWYQLIVSWYLNCPNWKWIWALQGERISKVFERWNRIIIEVSARHPLHIYAYYWNLHSICVRFVPIQNNKYEQHTNNIHASHSITSSAAECLANIIRTRCNIGNRIMIWPNGTIWSAVCTLISITAIICMRLLLFIGYTESLLCFQIYDYLHYAPDSQLVSRRFHESTAHCALSNWFTVLYFARFILNFSPLFFSQSKIL